VSLFVISLESAFERREHICAEFGKKAIPFNFFNAVTPQLSLDVARSIGIDLSRNGTLTSGEVACLLSHVLLWKSIVDQNIEYMAIFEDDVYLGENTQNILKSFSWIPKDVHLIKLEAFDYKADLSFFPKFTVNDRAVYHLKAMHLGGAGYILSNKAAKHFLKFICDMPELLPVDHILFGRNVKHAKYKAYQMNPAICAQDFYVNKQHDNFPSHLEEERAIRHELERLERIKQKQGLTLSDRIRREVFRLFHQIFKFSAYRTIRFK